MIRKSHSWSLTWTRDKSADQSGPSIVSLSSGQSQSGWQAHNAAGCILYFESSYRSLGSFRDLSSRSTFPISPSAPGWCFSRGGSSDVRVPFAIIPLLFAIIRARSRTFAIIRDIFTPLPPGAPRNSQASSTIPPRASLAELPTNYHEWLVTLGYTKTLEKLAQPRPEGLNIQTHRSCLHRFFKRYQALARGEDIAAAKEARPISGEDASVLFSDAENSFLHSAHQIATGPMNPDTFAKMNQWLQAHKDAETKTHYLRLAWRQLVLAEQRHAFNREKYELNVAQMALQHAAALQSIHANTALNHEARLRAARDILYGSLDPNETPADAKQKMLNAQ